MTNIISFSLWGDDRKYTNGAVENAKLAKRIYPGWTCRFYVGEDVPVTIINELEDKDNAEVIKMSGTGWNGMFWRFLAADGPDTVIVRDTDSRVGPREKAAVDEWLASDKDFHIMRDHPYHATEILGGMWGARNGILDGMVKSIKAYQNEELNNKYQIDQAFLREVVWPEVKDDAMIHDEFFSHNPFPKSAPPRTPSSFVGQVYDGDGNAQF